VKSEAKPERLKRRGDEQVSTNTAATVKCAAVFAPEDRDTTRSGAAHFVTPGSRWVRTPTLNGELCAELISIGGRYLVQTSVSGEEFPRWDDTRPKRFV
jgi:hypothetical protein